MILLDDLKRISKMFSFTLFQTQVNYYQSIILFSISKYPLAFKGGTYLWFCHNLPRFSEDLDFTLLGEIDAGKLKKDIVNGLSYFGANAEIRKSKVAQNKNSIGFRVNVEGLLFSGKQESKTFVNIDISKRESVLLETQSCRLNLDYYKIPEFFVRGFDLREVLAEKIRAVYSRSKGRDLYDLNFLINKGVEFDLGLVNEKLKFLDMKFSKKDFLKRIAEAKSYYDEDVKFLTRDYVPFDVVRSKIIEFIDGNV